jgi:hypothetical protein
MICGVVTTGILGCDACTACRVVCESHTTQCSSKVYIYIIMQAFYTLYLETRRMPSIHSQRIQTLRTRERGKIPSVV